MEFDRRSSEKRNTHHWSGTKHYWQPTYITTVDHEDSFDISLWSSQKQVSMFDEALGVIAASRVMLGQLFWRSREDAVALKELEPSCPILWEYDIAKTSLDSNVSFDIFVALTSLLFKWCQCQAHSSSHSRHLPSTNCICRDGWTATPPSVTYTSVWDASNKLLSKKRIWSPECPGLHWHSLANRPTLNWEP